MPLPMVRHIATAFFASICITVCYAQEKMRIHLKNGDIVEYNIDDVDHVEMESFAVSDKPSVEGVKGTIAEAVDMGLSVYWAEHNLGSDNCSADGTPLPWQDASEIASLWGKGWRVPTKEEWEELYSQCTWRWTIVNGIGGRIITGQNGNSIFIPAAGFTIDQQKMSYGNMGLYWSDTREKTTAEEPQSAIGFYFDSANIYSMSYPTLNTFTVRLVKDRH